MWRAGSGGFWLWWHFIAVGPVTDADANSTYVAQSGIDTSAECFPSNGDHDRESDDIGEAKDDDDAADSASIDGDGLIDGADDDHDEKGDAAVSVAERAIFGDCFVGHTC
nr:unnamed protein product [Fasciola hepatica]